MPVFPGKDAQSERRAAVISCGAARAPSLTVGSDERDGKAMLTDLAGVRVLATDGFFDSTALGAEIFAGGDAGETHADAISPSPKVKRTLSLIHI